MEESIYETDKHLSKLADRFVEILLESQGNVNDSKRLNNIATTKTLKSDLLKTVTEEKQNQVGSVNLNKKIDVESEKCSRLSKERYETPIVNTFGQERSSRLCELCNSASSALSKGKSLTLKKLVNAVTGVIKQFTNENKLMSQTQQTIAASESVEAPKGYFVCENPLYGLTSDTLNENDYYDWNSNYNSGTSKTVKATILTIVTFVVTMVLTNVVRIYFGGTPGGAFSSPAEKGLFSFFSCLIIAPLVEEPAKMISIKGGYGKQFFFTFNLLEFGGYIVMFLALGAPGLGIMILFRALAVIMHGITTRIQMSGGNNNGLFKTTVKLAISILLHFMFNALFLKSSVMGLPANKVCLFAIGFMGVAFGVFKLLKKGVSTMTDKFTTRSNLEYEYQ